MFLLGHGLPHVLNLGTSLDDSLIEDNDVTGAASMFPILFYDVDGSNRSARNHLSIGAPFERLGGVATLYVSPGAQDNVFSGHCGTIIDLAPGQNTYLGAHCSP